MRPSQFLSLLQSLFSAHKANQASSCTTVQAIRTPDQSCFFTYSSQLVKGQGTPSYTRFSISPLEPGKDIYLCWKNNNLITAIITKLIHKCHHSPSSLPSQGIGKNLSNMSTDNRSKPPKGTLLCSHQTLSMPLQEIISPTPRIFFPGAA